MYYSLIAPTETLSGKVLCITNKADSSKEISAGSAEQDKELSDNSALFSTVKLDHIDELLVKEGILLQVPNYKGNVPVHFLLLITSANTCFELLL